MPSPSASLLLTTVRVGWLPDGLGVGLELLDGLGVGLELLEGLGVGVELLEGLGVGLELLEGLGVGDGPGQFTQNVLCFWGSCTNCSLKCSPSPFTGASPLASALATRVAVVM